MTETFLFFIGLFIGSFLNVIVDRIPRGESIIVGRSHCDFCKHPLSWYDLIPLFSFLLARGKCRYCNIFIGWKYPIIELTTGILFTITGFLLGLQSPLFLFITLGIVSCLIVILFTDIFTGIIPDVILVALLLFAIGREVILRGSFFSAIVAACIACLFFLLLFLITRGKGMGFGDVKYAFVMGLLLSFPFILTGLYLAFLTGACIALILIVIRKKGMKSSIPFGPFLVLGTIVNIFFGAQLWTLFIKILGI